MDAHYVTYLVQVYNTHDHRWLTLTTTSNPNVADELVQQARRDKPAGQFRVAGRVDGGEH